MILKCSHLGLNWHNCLSFHLNVKSAVLVSNLSFSCWLVLDGNVSFVPMAVDANHICISEDRAGLISPWKQDFVLPPEILAVQVEPGRWIHPQKQFLLAAGKITSSYSGCFFFLIDACIHCTLWISVLVRRCERFSNPTWIHFSEAPSVCLGEIFINQHNDTEAGKYQAPCSICIMHSWDDDRPPGKFCVSH